MKTLDLLEAAEFLKMHPQTLRRRAAAREIPSAKPGKHWVFIDSDLAEWLRSQYNTERKQVKQCSTNVQIVQSGGADSHRPAGSKYADLLALQSKKTQRNTRQS